MRAASPREIEFKRRIPDRAAFDSLIALAGGRRDPPILQENFFFDSAGGDLAAARLAFRLRLEGRRCEVTLKGPVEGRTPGAPVERVELEWEVEEEIAEAVRAGRQPPEALVAARHPAPANAPALARRVLEVAARTPLRLDGSFRNERTRVHTHLDGLSIVLEFDRTELPGGRVDYEVELEIDERAEPEPYRAALDGWLSRAGVPAIECPGKLARYRELVARSVPPG